MRNEQFEAIRKRAEKATAGPWSWDERGTALRDANEDPVLIAVEHKEEAWIDAWPKDEEFIANAREDIPALLAEVERLKSQRDELIGSVFEHCNAFSEPFCIAERLR